MPLAQLPGPSGMWKLAGVLGLLLLPAGPVEAWYKQVTSPRYHTVGRASGLLLGVRRSPYVRRRGTAFGDFPLPDSLDSAGDPQPSVNALQYHVLVELLRARTREQLQGYVPEARLLASSLSSGRAEDTDGLPPPGRALHLKGCSSQIKATGGGERAQTGASRLLQTELLGKRLGEAAKIPGDSNDLFSKTKCTEDKDLDQRASTLLQGQRAALQTELGWSKVRDGQETKSVKDKALQPF